MSSLNSKRNRKRGFTVVELVVALAVILIVSATAIGLVNTQNTIYLRTMQTTEATNMAENAIECFRFVGNNDGESFEDLFKKTGYDLQSDTVDGATVYTVESNGMEVTITINGSTLDFLAVDGDKEILRKSYTYTN